MSTIYQIDNNGVFVKAIDLTDYKQHIPVHVVTPPPKTKKNQTAVWNGTAWVAVDNYKPVVATRPAPIASPRSTSLVWDLLNRRGLLNALSRIVDQMEDDDKRAVRAQLQSSFVEPGSKLEELLRAAPFALRF
jgi:hypothetical protein